MKRIGTTSKPNSTRRKESNNVNEEIPYSELCKTFQSNVWSLINSNLAETSGGNASMKGKKSSSSSSKQYNKLKMKRKPQLGLGRISTYFLESDFLRYSMYEYLTNQDLYNLSCTCCFLTFYPEGMQSLNLYRADQPLIAKIKEKIKEGKCNRVKRISIIENTIPTLIKSLSSSLYLLPTLSTIHIERNEIDHGSIRYLAKAFLNTKKGVPKLEKFTLRNNIIAQYGTKLIAPVLPNFQHLKYINIGRNGFQDNGILDLCDPAILPNCPSLTCLVLTYDEQKAIDSSFVSNEIWESIENFRDNFAPEVTKLYNALDSLSELRDFCMFFSRHYVKSSDGNFIFGVNRHGRRDKGKQQTIQKRNDEENLKANEGNIDSNENMDSQSKMKIPQVTLFSKSGVPDVEDLNSVQRLQRKRTSRSTVEMSLHSTELLAPILPSMRFLLDLELSGNGLTCSAIQQLSMVLPYCRSLKYLNLDDNNIGSLGLIVLCSSLERLTSLERLNLRYNRIYALGIEDGLAAYLNIKGIDAFTGKQPDSESSAINFSMNSTSSNYSLTSLPASSDYFLRPSIEVTDRFHSQSSKTPSRDNLYQNFISKLRIRSIDLQNNELKLKGCDILADVLSNLTERVVTELELEDQNFVLDTPYLNILVGKNGLQEQELETLKAQYDPYITSSLMLFS